jgi:hypothetical protein
MSVPCDDLFNLDLPPNKMLILLAVASGEISVPRIAWKTQYSRPQVWRLVKALTKDKLLKVTRASLGKNRTLYALNDEIVATWERKQPYQNDGVDYAQPNQIDEVKPDQPNHNDGVSDSQLDQIDTVDGVELDQIDTVDGVELDQDDRVDIVGENPPKNPLGIQEINTVIPSNETPPAPVDNLLDWLKKKDPMRQYDRDDLQGLITTYTFDWIQAAFEQAYFKSKPLDNPTGYVVKTVRGWTQTGKPDYKPPSVPPVSPNGKHADDGIERDMTGKPLSEETKRFLEHQRRQGDAARKAG